MHDSGESKAKASATEYMLVAQVHKLKVRLYPENILGRESGLETDTMSRRHCQIVTKDNRWFLADLNSTNGTFLNGKKMKPREWYTLKVGDEIEFGSLIFNFAGPSSEAEATFDPPPKEDNFSVPGVIMRWIQLFRRKPRS